MIPMGPHQNKPPLKLPRNHQKTNGKPWAQKDPENSQVLTPVRPLLAASINNPLSANKNDKRHLASVHQNKQLSATGERSMKLSKPKNDKLRVSYTGVAALSKKVSKVISASKQNQSKTGHPRAQTSKVIRTKISKKISRKNLKEIQEHKSALGIKQEFKVTSTRTPTLLTLLGRYLKRFVLLGFALLGFKGCISAPREIMNEEESYIKPSPEVPTEIFDTTTQTSQDEKLNLDKFGIEKPFACRICHGAFADPQDLKSHVEKRSCRQTKSDNFEPPTQEATIRSLEDRLKKNPAAKKKRLSSNP